MNRRRFLIAVVFLAGVGVVACGTWRCLNWMARRYSGADRASPWASETWAKLLSLSDHQRSKILSMEKVLKEDSNLLQIELAKDQIALCRVMMSTGPIDSAGMFKTASRAGNIKIEMEKRVLTHLMALREILSPEQRRKFFTTMMKDLCQGCRSAANGKNDYCGMCLIR